jgi:hypothetical protein
VTSQVLSLRAVNRALLARQLLLDRQVLAAAEPDRAAQVVQAIEHLVGLQAQAPFPPYYGLHSRLDGLRPGDLAALITDRRVVRIALMRGTIHLVSARDCPPPWRRECARWCRWCRCRRAPSGAGPGSRCTRRPNTGSASEAGDVSQQSRFTRPSSRNW